MRYDDSNFVLSFFFVPSDCVNKGTVSHPKDSLLVVVMPEMKERVFVPSA